MQKIFAPLLNLIATLLGGKKPPLVRCQFCGEAGHATEDCPKAAKYKLFHVDRE